MTVLDRATCFLESWPSIWLAICILAIIAASAISYALTMTIRHDGWYLQSLIDNHDWRMTILMIVTATGVIGLNLLLVSPDDCPATMRQSVSAFSQEQAA
jgi:Trk-type K+ transport system membrane component